MYGKSKVDTVSIVQLEKVKAIIRTLQPKNAIFETNFGQIDVYEIFNTNKFEFEESSMSAGWIQELEVFDAEENPFKKSLKRG